MRLAIFNNTNNAWRNSYSRMPIDYKLNFATTSIHEDLTEDEICELRKKRCFMVSTVVGAGVVAYGLYFTITTNPKEGALILMSGVCAVSGSLTQLIDSQVSPCLSKLNKAIFLMSSASAVGLLFSRFASFNRESQGSGESLPNNKTLGI